jgi:hypothetical protein
MMINKKLTMIDFKNWALSLYGLYDNTQYRIADKECREDVLNKIYGFTKFGVDKSNNSIVFAFPGGRCICEVKEDIVFFDYVSFTVSEQLTRLDERIEFWMNRHSVEHLKDEMMKRPEDRENFEDVLFSL